MKNLLTIITVLLCMIACTPKREAALTSLAADKVQCLARCAADHVDLPASDTVKICGAKCAVPTGRDLENLLDLIAGQKSAARRAGATIPDDPDPSAGTGYLPRATR